MAAILDFWIFPKLQESVKIERKVTKTNKKTLIWNIKFTGRKVIIFILKKEFFIFWKKKKKLAVKNFLPW